jgi:hypothetical protein
MRNIAIAFASVFVVVVLLRGAPPPTTVPTTSPTWDQWSALPTTRPATYSSEAWKLKFGYPGDFVVGKFAPQKVEADRFFTDAIVLIESAKLGTLDRERIPVGDVATISLHRLSIKDAAMWLSLARKTPPLNVGPHEAFKLPGFPGPYGESAFVYIVPLSDDAAGAILVMGHKFDWRDRAGAKTPTHYDWVIERIVATLEVGKM